MVSNSRLIALTGILTFVLLGAIQSLYGPLLPEFRREFLVDTATVGLVFSAHGFGALLGILAPSLIRVSRFSTRLLGIASGFTFAGAAALWIAPNWSALLAAAFVLALGFGIHVVRLNSMFVAGFGSRGMMMSQLLNAAFSVGTILGPLAVAISGDASRRVFVVIAVVTLALLPLSVVTDTISRSNFTQAAGRVAATAQVANPWKARALLAAFMLLMCLAVGVETSIGGWTATLAIADGYSFNIAANLTALFFGSVLIGRLLAAWIGHRVSPANMVVPAVGCVAVILVLSIFTSAGPIAFALSGLAIAPIFSATLVWLRNKLPSTQHGYTLVVGGALLGSAVFPPAVGRVVDEIGAESAPVAILVLVFAAWVVSMTAKIATRA